jgi:hypothetical protein
LSVIAPFPHPRDRRLIASFDRRELARILDLYGRMVAAGHWRDYAMPLQPRRGGVRGFPSDQRAPRDPHRETP